MTRITRDEQRLRDEQARRVVTVRPGTVVGGFPWLALAPLLAAAATPVASSVGKWVGKKVFGEGASSSAAGAGLKPAGAGVQRAGERPSAIMPRPMPLPPMLAGRGSSYRAGDYPMPTLVSIGHHKSQPSDTRGIGGGIMADVVQVIKNPKAAAKKAICKKVCGTRSGATQGGAKGSAAMKAKMAALRAMKKKV